MDGMSHRMWLSYLSPTYAVYLYQVIIIIFFDNGYTKLLDMYTFAFLGSAQQSLGPSQATGLCNFSPCWCYKSMQSLHPHFAEKLARIY